MISPLAVLVGILSHGPAMAVLYWMHVVNGNYRVPFNAVGDLIEWLANTKHIPFYIGICIELAIFVPLFYIMGRS